MTVAEIIRKLRVCADDVGRFDAMAALNMRQLLNELDGACSIVVVAPVTNENMSASRSGLHALHNKACLPLMRSSISLFVSDD